MTPEFLPAKPHRLRPTIPRSTVVVLAAVMAGSTIAPSPGLPMHFGHPAAQVSVTTVTGPVVTTAGRSRTRDRDASVRASRSRHLGPDFAALAQCESSGDPTAVSPSGRYRGLYQFSLDTWSTVGGKGDPAAATSTEQTYRARLLYARRGAEPWPVCGSRL